MGLCIRGSYRNTIPIRIPLNRLLPCKTVNGFFSFNVLQQQGSLSANLKLKSIFLSPKHQVEP